MSTATLFFCIFIGALGVLIFILLKQSEENRAELAALKERESRLEVLLFEYRNMWDHLPRSLPISDERRRLAQEIGFASIAFVNYGEKILQQIHRSLGKLKETSLDPLVLMALNEKDPQSLMMVPRTILFQSFNASFDPDLIMQNDGPMTLVVGLR